MGLLIKASDLYHKYPKDTINRHTPKFCGKPDPNPFNMDDLYDVLPMLGAVMDELGRDDGRALHQIEEIMIYQMPRWLENRGEVFDFLVGCSREVLGPP